MLPIRTRIRCLRHAATLAGWTMTLSGGRITLLEKSTGAVAENKTITEAEIVIAAATRNNSTGDAVRRGAAPIRSRDVEQALYAGPHQ